MRTEWVALSPAAVLAVFGIGGLVRDAIDATTHAATLDWFMVAMLLLLIRADARSQLPTGTYRQKWLVWRLDASPPPPDRREG